MPYRSGEGGGEEEGGEGEAATEEGYIEGGGNAAP